MYDECEAGDVFDDVPGGRDAVLPAALAAHLLVVVGQVVHVVGQLEGLREGEEEHDGGERGGEVA